MRQLVTCFIAMFGLSCATSTSPSPPGVVMPLAGQKPAESLPTVELKDSFHFVHCLDQQAWVLLDNDRHLELEEALLEDSGQELSLMAGAQDGFVIAQALSAEGLTAARSLVGEGRYRLFNGGHEVAVSALGTPRLVGRVVPHFGMVEEWSRGGIGPESAEGELARRDLRNTAAMHLMAPLSVSCKEDSFYWARPEWMPEVSARSYREVGAKTEAKWAERTAALRAWSDPQARVKSAYLEQGANLPELDIQVFALSEGGAQAPCVTGCTHVQLRLGTTLCGMGPDEAVLSVFWDRDGLRPSIIEERNGPLAPILMGDFDGDGTMEVVGRTDSLSQTIELFRIEPTGLVPVKSTSLTFADCPC